MKNSPYLSVIMPVYNGEKYLQEAIESILNQTFTDFELIIINDCSTDSSEEIVKSYTDTRIVYLKNEVNSKAALTRNKGFKQARGKYIALMDCDDVSINTRFEKQIKFLDAHLEYGLVGSLCAKMDTSGKIYETSAQLTENQEIQYAQSLVNTFCGSSVILRREIVEKYNLYYDLEYPPVEDYELGCRACTVTKVHNIPEILYLYRINPEGVSLTQTQKAEQLASKVSKKYQASKIIPNISIKFLKEAYSRRNLYKDQYLPVMNEKYHVAMQLAYQTALYKLGILALQRKNIKGLAVIAISFLINPSNWFTKIKSSLRII